MIVRAAKYMDACTELMFPHESPGGFVCGCAPCEDIQVTKLSEITKRKSMLDQLDRLCKSNAHDLPKKFERLLKALNKTYNTPEEEVPRLLLWDPQLLLTLIYMEQHNLSRGLESVSKTLQTLGFIVDRLDRTPAGLVVTKWGHTVDHLVETFLHARTAFEQLRLWEKSRQAEQYARVAYRGLVGKMRLSSELVLDLLRSSSEQSDRY
jgi:hypothetical protein